MSRTLYFSATYCQPCKVFKPYVQKEVENNDQINVDFLDVTENSELAQKYNITNVPTMIKLQDDEEVDRVVGVINPAKLKEFLV
jgi:thioredoxin 1